MAADVEESRLPNVQPSTPGELDALIGTLSTLVRERAHGVQQSPPQLNDCVTALRKHVVEAFRKQAVEQLQSVYHFRVFLGNLRTQFTAAAALLNAGSREAFLDATTSERRELTRLTLILSHMETEIRTLFPNGQWSAPSHLDFSVVRAQMFWEKYFQSRTIVTHSEFLAAVRDAGLLPMKSKSGLDPPLASDALESAFVQAVNVTSSGHVSSFELDVFTRLYQPWRGLVAHWQFLISHPAYKAYMTYDEVEEYMTKFTKKKGSYVFRTSVTRLGQWAIGYVCELNQVVQTIPSDQSLYDALIEGSDDGTYCYPDGLDENPDIRTAVAIEPEELIVISPAMHQQYVQIGSLFEVCKICAANRKNVMIMKCRHLLCTACLQTWRRSGHSDCPFCRERITGADRVLVVHAADLSNAAASASLVVPDKFSERTGDAKAGEPMRDDQEPGKAAPVPEGTSNAGDKATGAPADGVEPAAPEDAWTNPSLTICVRLAAKKALAAFKEVSSSDDDEDDDDDDDDDDEGGNVVEDEDGLERDVLSPDSGTSSAGRRIKPPPNSFAHIIAAMTLTNARDPAGCSELEMLLAPTQTSSHSSELWEPAGSADGVGGSSRSASPASARLAFGMSRAGGKESPTRAPASYPDSNSDEEVYYRRQDSPGAAGEPKPTLRTRLRSGIFFVKSDAGAARPGTPRSAAPSSWAAPFVRYQPPIRPSTTEPPAPSSGHQSAGAGDNAFSGRLSKAPLPADPALPPAHVDAAKGPRP